MKDWLKRWWDATWGIRYVLMLTIVCGSALVYLLLRDLV